MKSLILKCKLITPMFMTGADGKTPELRPSEFKGMMRFWWRAIKAEDDIGRLKKEEAEIFGGSGEGQGRSAVAIRIISKLDKFNITKFQPLPHHRKYNCPIDNQNRCNKTFLLSAIKEGTHIIFEFIINKLEFIEQLEPLIYLMFILGGFGKRSRRGFGSIKIIEPKKEIRDLNSILPLLNSIGNGKYDIGSSIMIKNIQAIINKKPSSSSYPWIREIIIGKDFNSCDGILKAIGIASHNHRNPSLGNANPRMASPIYVSVIEVDNKLKPIITVLSSRFPESYPRWDFNKQKEFIRELVL